MLIDKPKGWTSFDVCGKLRGQLKRSGCKKVNGSLGLSSAPASSLFCSIIYIYAPYNRWAPV
jgi:hypothetical protein